MTPDPGLQPERTALAWRRTAMSVVVGSVGLAKALPMGYHQVGVALAVGGLAWAADLALASHRRHRDATAAPLKPQCPASAQVLARTAVVAGLAGLGMLCLVLGMSTG